MQSIAETCVRFDAAHLSINLVSEIAVPMFTTLTSLRPIPLKNVEFRDGMGLRLVNGIPCLSAFSGVDQGGHH